MNAHLPLLAGEARIAPHHHVTGWCYMPARRGHRLAVELIVDGRFHSAMLATLASPGIGDGRHGFALRLPADTAAQAHILELRERDTGRVFARILPDAERLDRGVVARLDGLDLSALTGAGLAWVRQDASAGQTLHAAFAGLGRDMRALFADPLTEAVDAIRRRLPRLRLSPAPELSIVVAPGAAASLREALLTAQPQCDVSAAEILLLDDGSDAAPHLYARADARLRVLRVASGQWGAALNTALAEARGRRLCLVAPGLAIGGAWPGAEDPGLHVALTAGMAPAGMGLASPGWQPGWQVNAAHTSAVLLGAPCAVLQEAGGFSGDQLDQALADMALRVELLGMPVTLWPSAAGRG